MKSILKFSAILLLISLGIVTIFLFLNQLAINSYDDYSYSRNVSESQEENLFIDYYIPNKDSIKLSDRKVSTKLAWCEISWKATHNFIFFSDREIHNEGLNLIIQDTSYCNQTKFLYSTNGIAKNLNCSKNSGPIFHYFSRSDTIQLYIIQGSEKEGWLKEVISDSVLYIRKK